MENYQYGVIKLDVHDRGFGPYSCLGVRFCQGSGGGGGILRQSENIGS